MSEATINAKIEEILKTVSGIGTVHDFRRTSRSLSAILELMRKSGSVNGWQIYRVQMPSSRNTNNSVRKSHHFRIDGIYELVDATGTEKVFQALIDNIFTKFMADQTLGDLCEETDTIQVLKIDAEDLKGTIYHTVEMLLVCHEREYYPMP